jgi:hypothetical protein
MEKPTINEVLELVSFRRDKDGKLFVRDVHGNVNGHIYGYVQCVHGNIGMVHGNVSDVFGTIWGTSSDILRDEVVKQNQKSWNT